MGLGSGRTAKAAAADELLLCVRISGNNKYPILDKLLIFTFFFPKSFMRNSELHNDFSSVLNPVLERSRLLLNVFDIEDVALTKVKTKASQLTFVFVFYQ